MANIISIEIDNKKLNISNGVVELYNKIIYAVSGTTLTIKAGSIAYKPNGFNAAGSFRFDKVEFTKDYNFSSTAMTNGVSLCGKSYRCGAGVSPRYITSKTKPSKVHCLMWHNLVDNKLYRYMNTNASGDFEPHVNYTFPFMYVTWNNSKMTNFKIIKKFLVPTDLGNLNVFDKID